MDSTLAAILSVMAPATPVPPAHSTAAQVKDAVEIRTLLKQWPLAGPTAPAKGAGIKMLRLLKRAPQPDLRAIANRIGHTERAVQRHLQTLFRVGLIKKLAFYELTGAGRAWVNYDNELIRWGLIEQRAPALPARQVQR